jgi:ABC-type sugar transport system permease subunit
MFFRVLFYLPNIIGTVVFASLYYYVVAADGPLLTILSSLNMPISEQLQMFGFLDYGDTALGSIIVFGVWLALGGNTIVLTGAMTRIPEEIFESGRLEGIGVWREFFQMVCPLIWSTISTLLIFQLAAITTFDFGTFLLMGESAIAEVRTMGYYIFMLTYNVSRGAEVANKPAALGLIITIVTVPVVMICRAIIEKLTYSVEF